MAGQGDAWKPTDTQDVVRARIIAERQARRSKRRAAVRAWLAERGLLPLAGAMGAGAATAALAATGTLLRTPCDGNDCPAYAGVPAAILETLALVSLLIGLAAAGTWIAGITQRTWVERLRLRRTELELAEGRDTGRMRRIDAVLQDDVASIHAQARLYFWAGLPAGLLALILLPPAIGAFTEAGRFAAYAFPFLLLAAVAGTAATVRGMVLGVAARRLTAPLRDVAEKVPKLRKGSKARGVA